jgi:DNA-binding MarR family transcriptional regulator
MASGHEMAMALRAAYWAMHRQTQASLAGAGVTADQFVLLALLAERDGITQQELVRRASSDANTVRAMLVLMESRGLVARRGDPSDRRARHVTLTRRGRQAYERLWSDSEPVRQRLLAAFQPEEKNVLVGLLSRIPEAMTPAAADHGGRRRPSATIHRARQLLKGERR